MLPLDLLVHCSRVSSTTATPGNALEFEIAPGNTGNTGNLPELVDARGKFYN